MKINIESAEQFDKLLNTLSDEIVYAECYFKLYKDLLNAVPDYIEVFNESNTFWSLTMHALLDVTLSRLCRVYDTHQDSLNLLNLLDTIKANLEIFETEKFKERLRENPFVESLAQTARKPDADILNSDMKSVCNVDHLVKKLVIWRNNIIAHRTALNVVEQKNIIHDYPITRDEISNLLTRATTILNRYSGLFRASTYSTHIVGADDYLYILKTIKEKIDKHKRNIASEVARYRKYDNNQTK